MKILTHFLTFKSTCPYSALLSQGKEIRIFYRGDNFTLQQYFFSWSERRESEGRILEKEGAALRQAVNLLSLELEKKVVR